MNDTATPCISCPLPGGEEFLEASSGLVVFPCLGIGVSGFGRMRQFPPV